MHACPVWPSRDELEAKLVGDGHENHFTRKQALWSGARVDLVERHLDRDEDVHLGPVAGVRCVVTGHTPVPEPKWHHNVLAIDTGVAYPRRRAGPHRGAPDRRGNHSVAHGWQPR